MRTNKILNYESILQVLDDPGCPFCRFMKNFQASVLQDTTEKNIHHLCNFHTWGLAATQQAASAADVFLHLLERQADPSSPSSCDVCILLQLEEALRIREFLACLQHKLVAQWLKSHAAFCTIHGTKLKQGTDTVLASTITSIMERYRLSLVEELTRMRKEHQPSGAKWGVLGNVAEFLVSQRGLHV